MIDRAHLRRTLVTGWKPRQSVQIEVGVLAELLDECDRLEALRTQVDELKSRFDVLAQEGQRMLFQGRKLENLLERGDASDPAWREAAYELVERELRERHVSEVLFCPGNETESASVDIAAPYNAVDKAVSLFAAVEAMRRPKQREES
jgi:hypothetical protein